MYTQEKFRKQVETLLKNQGIEEIKLEKPPEGINADLAFPCFDLGRKEKKNPVLVAKELKQNLEPSGLIEKIDSIGPYVNFYVNSERFNQSVLENILKIKDSYGFQNIGKGKKALIEHTSTNPNASPHLGRARNAIIGDSLTRLIKANGYKTEVHYFVNDVGKQVGILVWGCSKKELRRIKFKDLLFTYAEAYKEIEDNPEYENAVRELLKKFESGDKKTVRLFEKIVKMCIEGQKKILKEINCDYDYFDYESRYLWSGETGRILDKMSDKVRTDENNRKILEVPGFDVPIVLTRQDGTSLYGLRDIVYTIEKIKRASDINVIVLGEDHKFYFRQLSAALNMMGYKPPSVIHYSFVLLPGGKMSTRKGDVVLLEDFIEEAKNRAIIEIEKRYENLSRTEIEKRAKMISIAAIRFHIIRVSPEKNVMFSWEDALNFEGDSGPYLQYTHARASSILENAGEIKRAGAEFLKERQEIELIKKLAQFPEILNISLKNFGPHLIANYLLEMAHLFNTFYQSIPVLKAEDKVREARVSLVRSVRIVLKNGLNLLGIDAPEKM